MSGGQQTATIVSTIVAAGAIGEYRAIARDNTQAAAGGGAGVPILGFADHAAVQGDAVKVNHGVTSRAISGAALNGTTKTLKTDANGRLIATTAGTDVVAAILKQGSTSTAADQIIEVYPVWQ